MKNPFLYDSLSSILGVIISAAIIYVAVVAFVRISGKRSTAQMNNFDWLVTVAMGSLMASGILANNVSVADSVAAIGTLLGLQWLLTRAMIQWRVISRTVRAAPALLFHGTEFQPEAMRRERISRYEMLAAVRGAGYADMKQVQSVILEADGTISVLPYTDADPENPALQDVHGLESGALR